MKMKKLFRAHFITQTCLKFSESFIWPLFVSLTAIGLLVFVWPYIYNNSKNRSFKRGNNKRVAYFLSTEPPGTDYFLNTYIAQ